MLTYYVKKISALLFICALVLALGGVAAAAERPHAVYDKVSDRLSLKAQNASLKEVLARIGLLSGVEFLMDSDAERPNRDGQIPPRIFSYAAERWQARLDRMPAEKRRELEAKMLERQEELAAKLVEARECKAKHLEKESQRKARRQAAEEELKQSNPELYELRQQQREALRQAYLDNAE